jgi:hypothetical protein
VARDQSKPALRQQLSVRSHADEAEQAEVLGCPVQHRTDAHPDEQPRPAKPAMLGEQSVQQRRRLTEHLTRHEQITRADRVDDGRRASTHAAHRTTITASSQHRC